MKGDLIIRAHVSYVLASDGEHRNRRVKEYIETFSVCF